MNNETKLELTVTDSGVSVTLAYDIIELTAEKMVLKYTSGTSSATRTLGKK